MGWWDFDTEGHAGNDRSRNLGGGLVVAVFVACMEFGAPIERFGVFYAFSMCLCCGDAEREVIVLSSYRKVIRRKMVGLVSWKVVFDLCIGSAGAASGIKANELQQ